MFKRSLLSSAIAAAVLLASGSASAGDANDGFIDGASMDIGIMYYGRERDHKNTNMKGIDANEIRVNALGVNTNLQSGWYEGWFGLDAAVFSNVDLMNGHGHGQSEVLYYDVDTGKERSSSRLGRLRARVQFGDEQQGMFIKAGITDINAGTIGTSAGINAHAYRGLEANAHLGNFSLSYGYADRFMADWEDKLHKIFYGDAEINDIQSLGGRYEVDNAWVDLAVGQGKGFRQNAHIAASYTATISNDTALTLTSYYQTGKYIDGTGDAGAGMVKDKGNAEREWTWSSSAVVAKGGWSFVGGYGQTYAPDSGEYNLRLATWGNSDHRNFLQTASTLDDFLWDGQKVVKAGVSYNFADQGLPGLTLGTNYFYSWDGYNLRGTTGENRDATMKALDFQIMYSFQSERLKGLQVGVCVWMTQQN